MPFFNAQSGEVISSATNLKKLTTTFTRPSDTTAYAAGDVVGPTTTPLMQTLAGAGRGNGGTGRIMEMSLECNLAVITFGTFRIHVFNALHTPAADNAAFATLHANAAAYQGYCDPPILVADGASAAAAYTRINSGIDATKGMPMRYVCAAGDTGLYVVVVALAAYVPSSAEVFRVSAWVEQD